MGCIVEHDGLRLDYRVHGISETVNEFIPFGMSQLHLGGFRHGIVGLSCCRRGRIFYGGRRFRCRNCLRLTHGSRHESAITRATSHAHKLRDRAGQPDSLDERFPPKPHRHHGVAPETRLLATGRVNSGARQIITMSAAIPAKTDVLSNTAILKSAKPSPALSYQSVRLARMKCAEPGTAAM